ncbi:hypothetical protein DFAR_4030012 [Desulfarculales bacterium]
MLWEIMDLKWEMALPAGDYGLNALALTIAMVMGDGASQVLELESPDPQSRLVAACRAGQKMILG